MAHRRLRVDMNATVGIPRSPNTWNWKATQPMATPIKTTSRYALDLAERIGSTFAVAFLGTLVTGGWFDVAHIRDVSALQAAGLAGIASVLSLVKGVAARWVSNRDSASLAPGV